MQLFVSVGGVCGVWCFVMKKALRNSEGLCIHDGGDEGNRTPDLLTASQALSQLSYIPVLAAQGIIYHRKPKLPQYENGTISTL